MMWELEQAIKTWLDLSPYVPNYIRLNALHRASQLYNELHSEL